jgi:hypothetical protein
MQKIGLEKLGADKWMYKNSNAVGGIVIKFSQIVAKI